MYVIKRDGRKQDVHYEKISSLIQKLCYGLNMEFVSPELIQTKVVKGLISGVTTVKLVHSAADVAISMIGDHIDYATLAARISVWNLHKETKKPFSDVIDDLYKMENAIIKRKTPMISDYHYGIIMKNADRLNSAVIYDRDFSYSYFGIKTLERSYLLKINGKIVERPQHMLMRVAIGIHGEDLDAAIETYNLLSERFFTHASPTLFAAASPWPQLSVSYLMSRNDDSVDGIYDTLGLCALISKSAGGIGLNIHNISAKGSPIGASGKTAHGLRSIFNIFSNLDATKYRNAFAIYIEPWHLEIFDFIQWKRPLKIFSGLWICNLFMKRVEANEDWSLMCPHLCPGLSDVWGEEFEKLYTKYESEGRATRVVKAQALWFAIIESQTETGTPYMLYKDACNGKSNQQNIGTIRCSNLCADSVQYSSKDEIAVCNLASIALNMFVKADRTFDFQKLKDVTKIVTKNLNKIIDVNYYPVPEAKRSNMRHRPISIGVQGLADAFILMKYPYESDKAQLLNQQIFETIYYGALEASCELAEKQGVYETYNGCPVSKGILQYEMWQKTPTELWDWAELKKKIAKHGVRNSLLTACMPTNGSSRFLRHNKSTYPLDSIVTTRRGSYDLYPDISSHVIKDLSVLGLWNDDMKNLIIAHNGSIQAIDVIPSEIRELYKTVWEISVRTSMKMAADRGAFIDQSQSFNIHVAEPNYGKLSSIHFYGWKLGLKTGMYVTKCQPFKESIRFLDASRIDTFGKEMTKKILTDTDAILEAECFSETRTMVRYVIMAVFVQEFPSIRSEGVIIDDTNMSTLLAKKEITLTLGGENCFLARIKDNSKLANNVDVMYVEDCRNKTSTFNCYGITLNVDNFKKNKGTIEDVFRFSRNIVKRVKKPVNSSKNVK